MRKRIPMTMQIDIRADCVKLFVSFNKYSNAFLLACSQLEKKCKISKYT